MSFPKTALNSGSALLSPEDATCRDLRADRKSVFGGVAGFALIGGGSRLIVEVGEATIGPDLVSDIARGASIVFAFAIDEASRLSLY